VGAFENYPNLALVTSAVIIILSLATLGYFFLRRGQPNPNLPKIGSRLQFAWIMAGLFILAALFSRGYLLLAIAFISFLALKEFLSITPTRRADRRVLFFAYLAVPIQFYLIWNGLYHAFILFVPIYTFFFLALLMVVIGETSGFLKAYSSLNFGLMLTVFSPGHLAYLLVLPPANNPTAGGLGLFLFLVILTQLSDVAQFLFGRLFRQPQLRLKVSLTRTWASLIGSIASTALLAWLAAPLLTPLTGTEAIAAGAAIAAGSFIGYLAMSAIKTDLQLKDRGVMTPGQGGVLNRLDSLIYTAPLFFHIVVYLHF
jgi:phosphatidate cytidylyltransferase